MANRINAGEKAMLDLTREKIISPSGADWCTIAADPFHDKPLSNLCGYPQEGVNGQSAVLKVPYQFNLSAPTGQVSNWSFLLTTYPFTAGGAGAPSSLVPYQLMGNHLNNAGTTAPPNNNCYPLSVYSGNDGNKLGPFHVLDAGNSSNVQGLFLEDSYATGPHRVIGWGVEVYDTTAVIKRQGSCTVWRQNTNTCDKTEYTYANYSGTSVQIGGTSGVIIRRPPESIAEANKLAGTKSWKSEDGCYLVCTMNSNDITIKQPDDAQPIIFQSDVSTAVRTPASSAQILSGPVNNVSAALIPPITFSVATPQKLWNFQPYNMSGAFFTGLDPAATFLIRMIMYVERFPTPDEPDIVLMTKPSAPYDPMALEIYDHMLHRMPVGVPVADNGLGEWFYDGIKAATNWALGGVPKLLGINTVHQVPPVRTRKALPRQTKLKGAQSSPIIQRPLVVKPQVRNQFLEKETMKWIRQKQASGQSLSKKEKAIVKSGKRA